MNVLAASLLVLLHRADGGVVLINPAQVTSLHAAAGPKNKVWTGEARCVIGMTDGKLVAVLEHCDTVRKMLEESR